MTGSGIYYNALGSKAHYRITVTEEWTGLTFHINKTNCFIAGSTSKNIYFKG